MKQLTLVMILGLAVVPAGRAQVTQTTPSPQEAAQVYTPSDPRLAQIVQLVQAGLSESLIAESIQKEKVPYSPTPQDLLYLKQNRVPESIIAALLAVQAPTSPGPGRQIATPEASAPGSPEGRAITGLVLKRGAFRKNVPGTLVFLEDSLEWRDARDATGNFVIYPTGIKRVELKCRALATGPFCYEMNIEVSKGDSFEFEDAEQAVGGNRAILALRDAWKEKYPRIPLVLKTQK